MHLTTTQVQHIAHLARIAITPEEVKKYQVELSQILDYVEQLNELDTTNVIPTYQVTDAENNTRPDVVDDVFTREAMLASAIETAEGHIKVKNVMKHSE